MNIKVNDVYDFWYNEEWRKKMHDPNWCFDGQLIVKENSKGELFLVDTYWVSIFENKSFTLEQALKRGELTFKCNLDDIEPIKSHEIVYYNDEDLFDLSQQHRCYKDYYKRKGAIKSTFKMEQVLKDKIDDTEREIKYKKSELERLQEKLEKVKNGDTDIYI